MSSCRGSEPSWKLMAMAPRSGDTATLQSSAVFLPLLRGRASKPRPVDRRA